VNFDSMCFVVMPFGVKEVDKQGRKVDFDGIYDDVFEPAIRAAVTPEGGKLEPRRTDRDFHSGLISQDMFEYIEYSRIVLADISSLNPNVFYELGHRHRAQTAGTVIVRQVDAPIPFDINQIKAFMYQFEPKEACEESRKEIARILTASLKQLRLDSPIRQALKAQETGNKASEGLLKNAEDALRSGDPFTATEKYKQAIEADPANPLTHQRLGLLYKDQDGWEKALRCFEKAAKLSPSFADAHREMGIALNKLAAINQEKHATPPGLAELGKAVELNPDDFDALASLGGVHKRAGDMQEALRCYQKSAEVSNGHPYPLLNALTLKTNLAGRLELSGREKRMLLRALRARQAQLENQPPIDVPWSLFDTAQAHLMLGNEQQFKEVLALRDEHDLADWQIGTFHETLKLLQPANADLPGLVEGLEALEAEL
jgi:tetratricopeptide (TPR) repeat protein